MDTQLETELLTKGDVMRITQSSLRTIDYLMSHGKIPYIKLGKSVRFARSDVEKFIESHKVGAK